MFNINILNQLVNNNQTNNLIWDNFANEICYLNKNYTFADLNFQKGVVTFSNSLKKRYSVSKSLRNDNGVKDSKNFGNSLVKKWVIDLFLSTIFNLFPQHFQNHSLVLVEFAFENIDFDSKDFLHLNNLFEVAEKLKKVESELESNYVNSGLLHENIKIEAATVGLVASIIYKLNQQLSKNELRWCDCCWRRSYKNLKYCSVHKPHSKGSNNNNIFGKNIFNKICLRFGLIDSKTYLDESRSEILPEHDFRRLQIFRKIFDEKLNLIFIENAINIDETATSNTIYIKLQLTTKNLIDSTLKYDWCNISDQWRVEMQNEFPQISKLLNKNANHFEKFEDFIIYVRAALNEKVETCIHPFWFLCELVMAETFLNCAIYSNPLYLRDSEIFKFSKSNISKKEICNKVGLEKSQIYAILKKDIENKKYELKRLI